MNRWRKNLSLRAALAIATIGGATFNVRLGAETPSSEVAVALAGPRKIEVIHERFPDGSIKIQREVTIDADGNYVNHGSWRLWDSAGQLVAEGQYDMGRRSGEWTRRYARDEAPLLGRFPFNEFEAPFVSRATFVDGELDGQWLITDARDRKCSQVSLRRGKRDGTSTLWLPNGELAREATFRRGLAVGDVFRRDDNGELTKAATYIDGHQVVTEVTNFPDTNQRKVEATFLTAVAVEREPDDYWALRFASYVAQGEQQRHGTWRTWHPNGQLESEGGFEFGRENGKFTWWHANGQIAALGNFIDGQEDGTWTWWHANGQKATLGEFRYGKLVGSWRGWNEEGKLTQKDEYTDDQAQNAVREVASLSRFSPELAVHRDAAGSRRGPAQ